MVVATARRAARLGFRSATRGVRWVEHRLTSPLQVLCYHRVAVPEHDPWELAVSPAAFAEQIAHVVAVGEVVRLDEELPRHRRRTLASLGRRGRPRVAITFDDGYVDNLRVALPILERHDAPATVFVPTAFIGGAAFWWDRLAVLVLGSGVPAAQLTGAFAAAGITLPADAAERGADVLHRAAWGALSEHGPREIDAVLDRVRQGLGVAAEPDGRPMTADELRELAEHPLITIGAHTRHHRMLTRLERDVVRREIVEGDERLDELFGRADRVLAYPHGNADRGVATAAASAGFSFALTTVDRPVSITDTARLLPRRHPKDVAAAPFGEWLAIT